MLNAVDAGTGIYDLELETEESRRPDSHRMLYSVESEEVHLDFSETDPAILDEDVAFEHHDDGTWQLMDPARRGPKSVGPAVSAEDAPQQFFDEITGEPLPAAAVHASRKEEVDFMEGWRCWERVGAEEAWRVGCKFI